MLVVPGELARVGIEGDCRVRVQRIVVRQVLTVARDQQRADVVGVAGPEIDQIQIRIVAADRPDSGTEALLHRGAVPTVAAGLPRTRDRVEAPLLGARLCIQPDDPIATACIDTQADTDDHLAVGDQRAARYVEVGAIDQAGAHSLLGGHDCVVPAHGAGLHVQRDDVAIRSRGIELVPIDRESLHSSFAPVFQRLRKRSDVTPQNTAVAGVDGFDGVGALYEQHSVVDQGRGFVGTRWQSQCPSDAETADGRLVDLLQRAVALGGVHTAPHEPVGRRGASQQLIGHRCELAQ